MSNYYGYSEKSPKKNAKVNPKFAHLRQDFIAYCLDNKPTAFLTTRKYPDDVLRWCKIGECTQAVYDELIEGQNYSKELMQEAGLLNEKGEPQYLNRVIFVNGDYFSAKSQSAKISPKYKNLFPKVEFAGNKKPFCIKGNSKRIIFVEGEPDAIAIKLFYPDDSVFAVGGVNSTLSVFQNIVEKLSNPDEYEFILALDNDAKGREWTAKFIDRFSLDYDLFQLHLPDGFKDIDELWRHKQSNGFEDVTINPVHKKEQAPEVIESIKLSFTNKSISYQHFRRKKSIFSLTQTLEYSLQIASLGVGNPDIVIYNKDDTVFCGQVNLYLKQMCEKRRKEIVAEMTPQGLKNLCKNLGITIKGQSREDLEEIVLNLNNFYENTLPVPEVHLRKIENGLEFLKALLKGKSTFDDEILTSLVLDVIEFDKNLVSPQQVMPFNPHKIISTNPKTGKSSLAGTIYGEATSENGTEAGLIGFASSDTRSAGKLHNRTTAIALDEIQEEKKDNILGKLHTALEKGMMDIPKGIRLTLETYATVSFLGNPKEDKNNPKDLQDYIKLTKFKHIIDKISTNTKAVASRIGLVLYGEFETVEGSLPTRDLYNKQIAYCRAFAQYYATPITKIFLRDDIQIWLSTSFGESYEKAIDAIIKNSTDTFLTEFLEGHKDSYRHLRGGALKLALLEIVVPKLNQEDQIYTKDIIDCAEKHLSKLMQINLDSFENLQGATQTDVFKQYYADEINAIKPTYAKLYLFAILQYKILNSTTENIIVSSQLQKIYVNEIVPAENISSEDKYSRFSRVENTITNNIPKVNHIFEKYGLLLDLRNEALTIIVEDENAFGKAIRYYQKVPKVTKVTDNTKESKK